MFKRDPDLLHVLTHKLYLLNTEIRSVAWSPDGSSLAAGTDEETIRIWSTSDGRRQRTLRRTGWQARVRGLFNGVSSVAWSHSGDILASSHDSGDLRLWRAADGELHKSMPKSPGSIWSISLSPDSRVIAAGASEAIRVYDVDGGALVRNITSHQSTVRSVAYNPAGDLLASGGDDKRARLWDATDGREVASFTGHGGVVQVVAWSPDGTLLASGSADGTVRLWRVADGTCVATLTIDGYGGVNALAWTPDGRRLACGGDAGVVQLWRVPDETLERTLKYRWGQDRVRSLAWHPDGTLLASGGRLGASSTKIGTTLVWRVDETALNSAS